MVAILKIFKYQTQLQSDLRYEKIVPNYTKQSFYGVDVIDDVTGWPQNFSLYSCLGEVGSGSKLQGQCHAVSANRILWVYAGFWWYHGILLVHLQDSVGAFGAKWLTKWLHHAKAPPRRGVLRWEWSNKDVHLVTTFVFCHVSKC